jgi:hypothetical protein
MKAHLSMFGEVRINQFYTNETISYKAKNLESIEVCGACELIEEMIRKNITPVFIDPTDDKHHTKSKASRKKKFQIDLPEKTSNESEIPEEGVEQKTVEDKSRNSLNNYLSNSEESLKEQEQSLKETETLKETLKETIEPLIQNPNFDDINETILESGETTLSEQVKMDAIQKEFNLTTPPTKENIKEVKETLEELKEKTKTLTEDEKIKNKYAAAFNYLENKDKVSKPIDEEIIRLPQPQHRQRSDGVYEFADDEIPKSTEKIKEVVKKVESTKPKSIHHVCEKHCSYFAECSKTNTHSKPNEHCNICVEEEQEANMKKQIELREKAKAKELANIPTTNLDDAYEAMFGFEDERSGK